MSKAIHQYLLTNTIDVSRTLHDLVLGNGPIFLKARRSGNLALNMARVVSGQQLSTKAAESIWARIEKMMRERATSLERLFIRKNAELLRQSGLSHNKIKAIILMVESFQSGELSSEKLFEQDYDSLTRTITSLWGFGLWSSDMIAISFFAYKDVWPDKDLAIRRGIERLSNGNFKEQKQILSACSPYRSYLAKHIWRGLNQNKI